MRAGYTSRRGRDDPPPPGWHPETGPRGASPPHGRGLLVVRGQDERRSPVSTAEPSGSSVPVRVACQGEGAKRLKVATCGLSGSGSPPPAWSAPGRWGRRRSLAWLVARAEMSGPLEDGSVSHSLDLVARCRFVVWRWVAAAFGGVSGVLLCGVDGLRPQPSNQPWLVGRSSAHVYSLMNCLDVCVEHLWASQGLQTPRMFDRNVFRCRERGCIGRRGSPQRHSPGSAGDTGVVWRALIQPVSIRIQHGTLARIALSEYW